MDQVSQNITGIITTACKNCRDDYCPAAPSGVASGLRRSNFGEQARQAEAHIGGGHLKKKRDRHQRAARHGERRKSRGGRAG